jgi:hypothetical protein
MPHETIIPVRDGWYWAIQAGDPEEARYLELVEVDVGRGRVWIAGSDVEDRPEDWRFFAGPEMVLAAVTARRARRTVTDGLGPLPEP